MLQILLSSILVLACALYAAWLLAPAAARRWAVRGVLAGPVPASWSRLLAPYASVPTGRACDGCERAAPVAKRAVPAASGIASTVGPIAGAPKPIVFHPRLKR